MLPGLPPAKRLARGCFVRQEEDSETVGPQEVETSTHKREN
jgi:hypothetical protein